MLRQVGLTILGIVSISSAQRVDVAQAVTVPQPCPVVSPDQPRPKDCIITSFPEAFAEVREVKQSQSQSESCSLWRGSGRCEQDRNSGRRDDKSRDTVKPYYPPDRSSPEGTIGSGTR